jgi:hypothetical protein
MFPSRALARLQSPYFVNTMRAHRDTPGMSTELSWLMATEYGMTKLDPRLIEATVNMMVNGLRDDVASEAIKAALRPYYTHAFNSHVRAVHLVPANTDVIPRLCQDWSHKHALFPVGDSREQEWVLPLRCVFCNGAARAEPLDDARYVAFLGCAWDHVACLGCYLSTLGRLRRCPHSKCRLGGQTPGLTLPTPATIEVGRAVAVIADFAIRGSATPFSSIVTCYPSSTSVIFPAVRLMAAIFWPSVAAGSYYEEQAPSSPTFDSDVEDPRAISPLALSAAAAPFVPGTLPLPPAAGMAAVAAAAEAVPAFFQAAARDDIALNAFNSSIARSTAVTRFTTPQRPAAAATAPPGAPVRPPQPPRGPMSPPPRFAPRGMSVWDRAFNPGAGVAPYIATQPSLEDAPEGADSPTVELDLTDDEAAAAAPAPAQASPPAAVAAEAAPAPAAPAAPAVEAGSKRRRGLREVTALLVDNAPDRISRKQARSMAEFAAEHGVAEAAPRTRAERAREMHEVTEALAELDELDAEAEELMAMEDAEAAAAAAAAATAEEVAESALMQ